MLDAMAAYPSSPSLKLPAEPNGSSSSKAASVPVGDNKREGASVRKLRLTALPPRRGAAASTAPSSSCSAAATLASAPSATKELDEPAVARRAVAFARRLRAAPKLVGKIIGSARLLLPGCVPSCDDEASMTSGPAAPTLPPASGAATATGDMGRMPACPSLMNPAPPASLPLKKPPPVPSPVTVGAVA